MQPNPCRRGWRTPGASGKMKLMLRRVAVLPVFLLLSCSGGSLDTPCTCTQPIGASECGTDSMCAEIADNTARGLMTAEVPAYHVVSSACGQVGVIAEVTVQGPACQCRTQGGGTLIIGPTGLPCSLSSRGGGCLWDTTAWPACDPAVADSCDATCAEAEARLAADAAHIFDTQVRLAVCDGVSCNIVIRVDDACYVRSPTSRHAYDCALSDEQILAAERARLGGGTSAGGSSGGGGTSAGGTSGGGGAAGGGAGSAAGSGPGSCRC